jgi:hypothetical protein
MRKMMIAEYAHEAKRPEILALTEGESIFVKKYAELQDMKHSLRRLGSLGSDYGFHNIAWKAQELELELNYLGEGSYEAKMYDIQQKAMRILAVKSENRKIAYVNDLLLQIHCCKGE